MMDEDDFGLSMLSIKDSQAEEQRKSDQSGFITESQKKKPLLSHNGYLFRFFQSPSYSDVFFISKVICGKRFKNWD